MRPLKKLDFTDLYVSFTGAHEPYITGVMNSSGFHRVPSECADDLKEFIALARINVTGSDHGDVVYDRQRRMDYDGVPYRLSPFLSQGDGIRINQGAVCGKGVTPIPALESLGLQEHVLNTLIGLGKHRGLVLIIGPKRHRKTTLACAYFAHVLRTYNAVGFTVEDPPELQLEGTHGERGRCYQLDLRHGSFQSAFDMFLGLGDARLLIGEIKTPDSASTALRAAVSGHPVVGTIHGGSVIEGLYHLLELAMQKEGEYAKTLLAQAITAAIFARPVDINGRRQVHAAEYLFADLKGSEPMRAVLRTGKLESLASVTDRQRALIGDRRGA